jgi:hypothetical protein
MVVMSTPVEHAHFSANDDGGRPGFRSAAVGRGDDRQAV